MKSLRPIVGLMVVMLVSCGSDSKPDKATPAPPKSFSERLNEKNSYQVDADGNWAPTSDRRSSFETQGASPYFKGDYDKKTYKTEEHTKKSWWGNKDYGHKSYEGNTDGSRFQQKSRFQGQGANEAATASNLPKTYQTDSYATKAAHEAGIKSLDRKSDPNVESRRNSYVAPEIIDWKEQRSMDLNESRGILGR